MRYFRFYLLNAQGRITERIDVECQDDLAATHWAEAHDHAHAIEVWDGRRRVALVQPGAGTEAKA